MQQLQRGLVLIDAAAFTNSFGHVEEQKWHRYSGWKVILQFANPMSYYIFMTELIDLRQVTEEEPMVQRFPRCRLAGDTQAFGQEPNAWFDRDSPRLI